MACMPRPYLRSTAFRCSAAKRKLESASAPFLSSRWAVRVDPHVKAVLLVMLQRPVLAARAGDLLPPLGGASPASPPSVCSLMWQDLCPCMALGSV